MRWFDVIAKRDDYTLSLSDRNSGELTDKNGSNVSFNIVFKACKIQNYHAEDELSLKLIDGMQKSSIEINISCPDYHVEARTIIICRESGVSFRIPMNHDDFNLFVAFLNSNTNDAIIRLMLDRVYPEESNSSGKLTLAAQLMNGEAEHLSYPDDEVSIRLVGFGLLFDTEE